MSSLNVFFGALSSTSGVFSSSAVLERQQTSPRLQAPQLSRWTSSGTGKNQVFGFGVNCPC